MTYLNGGYSIIKKNDANIFAKVNDALTNGKPILFYEDDNNCYYIDSISKSGDDIILTKGGKTILITSGNVVTESGNIQPKLYKYRFNVSDTYVTFVSTKLYKFETNEEYQINSDEDYTTCLLTGDLLQSLKDALTDLPDNTCYLVSDNAYVLNASKGIEVVDSDRTTQFELKVVGDVLTTDSTGCSSEIYLQIFEI